MLTLALALALALALSLTLTLTPTLTLARRAMGHAAARHATRFDWAVSGDLVLG